MLEGDQLERICRALLRRAHAIDLWDDLGCCFVGDVLERIESRSSGEAILVRAALATWRRGLAACDLGAIVHVLDDGHARFLGELLIALSTGSRAVEELLVREEKSRAYATARRSAR